MPAEPNSQSRRPIASESRNAFPLQTVPYEQPGQEKHEWHSEGVGKPDNRIEASPAPAVYYGICPPKARPRPKQDLQGRERAIRQDRVDCDHDDDDGRAKIPDRNAVIRVPGRFRPGYWCRTLHELPPSHSLGFEEVQRTSEIARLARQIDVIRYETREAASAADLGQADGGGRHLFLHHSRMRLLQLVVRGHADLEAIPKHLCRSWLQAKNPMRFCLARGP